MRFMRMSCNIMLKITVFSIIGILCIYLASCEKKKVAEEHIHTKVHVLKIEPTCISEGRIEYWFCSQCNKVFKDKDANFEISWESVKLPKIEHSIEVDMKVLPTCDSTGLTEGKHCSYCNMVIEEQKEIAALSHDYDFSLGTWQWEEFKTAELVVPCNHNNEHNAIYPATVTSSTLPATCTEPGKNIYTAKVSVEDSIYEDQKEEIILPLGHDFDLENIRWVWEEDTSASAQILCKNDIAHTLICDADLKTEVIPATCTSNGMRITTASVIILGQIYTNKKEVELEETGHNFDYTNMKWTWNDYENATATITCQNNQEHKESYEATITSQTEVATCTKDGKRTYIATIMINGITYENRKEEVLPALQHDFDYNNFTWKWTGYTQATIYFPCKNDESHLDSYAGHIQSSKEPATCVQEGKIIYTANVKIHSVNYSDEKEVIIPIDETAHEYDYTQPIWNWIASVEGYNVFIEVPCKCGKSSLQFEAFIVSTLETPATFEASGLKAYTAEIEFDGIKYSDTKTEELPMKQYVTTEAELLSAIEADAYDLIFTQDITINQEVHLTGRYASLDLNGFTLFVQDNMLSVEATHSIIANGYLVTKYENGLGSYALSVSALGNALLTSLITFGGINTRNANIILRDVDITATKGYAVSIQEESTVVIEKGRIRKNYTSGENYFFYVEGSSQEKEESLLSLSDYVELYTTIDTSLYNPIGISPSYVKKPVIISMDIKDYLSSDLDFKCLFLYEDLVYTEEDILNELIITGKEVLINLNGHTWFVPAEALQITSSYATITNGIISVLGEKSGNVITIQNNCTAIIDNIRTIGGIKIEDSSVTLTNVTINATIS
ncbi:MAG: hypothetical protein NC310_04560 [Roseburia sp.]|nr:hypothetical protein [Anaeroplasma bactoclasticum]MCM1196333.1 hypothetical protein [Roseburia sp.]